MENRLIFPSLLGWEDPRDTLHGYAKAVSLLPRAHALPHPRWWHISLKIQPDGLATDNMALPDGGLFYLKMDLLRHFVLLHSSRGEAFEFDMRSGASEAEFRDRLIQAAAGLGLEGTYALEKTGGTATTTYDPDKAQAYFGLLAQLDRIFKIHRAGLGGERGPVQLWPHGFDLAFEWFGTRQVTISEKGEIRAYPAQLNLGFSPGDSSHPEPYFYSNPWPFEADVLLEKPLPEGARWFTGTWQGSLLPYRELVQAERAEERLLEYARAVFEACAPTLLTGFNSPSNS